ncbi:MAG TPA: hypothetical protein VF763_14950 [Candidatus Limnocylindrales bacterium]
MDPVPSVAEALPALYRAVLDALADLERRGDRSVAVRLRVQAVTTYARPWDLDTFHRLEQVLERVRQADPGIPRELVASSQRGLRPWRRRPEEVAAR